MGHEYMELNNQSAAIQAYRQALGRSYHVHIVGVGKPKQ